MKNNLKETTVYFVHKNHYKGADSFVVLLKK